MESTRKLIDATSFMKIVAYLQNDADIEGIIDVRDEELSYVGDLFAEDSDIDGNVEKAKALLNDGKISIHFHAHMCRIPLENTVHCIRLDPYYIVKDLKKIYK